MNRNFADRVACETFEEILRNIIRDHSNGAAHIAAECLFAVRRLENALTASSHVGMPAASRFRSCAGANPATVRVISPVDKEDL